MTLKKNEAPLYWFRTASLSLSVLTFFFIVLYAFSEYILQHATQQRSHLEDLACNDWSQLSWFICRLLQNQNWPCDISNRNEDAKVAAALLMRSPPCTKHRLKLSCLENGYHVNFSIFLMFSLVFVDTQNFPYPVIHPKVFGFLTSGFWTVNFEWEFFRYRIPPPFAYTPYTVTRTKYGFQPRTPRWHAQHYVNVNVRSFGTWSYYAALARPADRVSR